MDKIKKLILDNFSIDEKEKELLNKICSTEIDSDEKIFEIVSNLINFRLDFDSVIAYLAYELGYKFDENTDADILKIYNTLCTNFNFNEGMSKQEQAEILRKMFIAMSSDVRVIVIRLYIMLYDVSKYKLPLTKDEYQNLLDIREIYAPLAERLGLNSLKSNLEDYCLKYLDPKTYDSLATSVMLQKDENEKQINITTKKLQDILNELGLKDGVITSRQKHFSSIYKKIKNKGYTLANIYDLIALRVLVKSVEDCYAVLGKIHGIYKPMEGRFKDYIASPKPNGYQSLHTTVIAENERPLEIQIRTFEMHKLAEFGVFAHWLYKEKKNKMSELDKKISWLREIMESSKEMSSEDFIDTLRTNLCEGQIYVQTPKGKVLEFVEGATALDFAYSIHSEIGNKCVGAKINGKIKPLSTQLNSGDVVEIITSQNSKGPSRDWLKFVKTSSAKSKINAYFKHEFKEENIKLGISMLEQGIKAKGYSPNKVLVDKYLALEQFKYVFNTQEELFASIGYGSVSVNNIVNKLCQLYEQDNKSEIQELPLTTNDKTTSLVIKKNKDGVLVDGDSGMLVRYAGCCSPVFGEDITGYISRGRGVTIHRSDCPNLKYLESERLIEALWDGDVKSKTTGVLIKIISSKSDKFLIKLTQDVVSAGYRILGLDSKENLNGKIVTVMKVEVQKREDINKIINIVKDINSVEDVFRVGN